MIGWIFVALAIIILLVLIVFFVWGIKKAMKIAINSVIGFFALYAVQAFMIKDLVINFLSVIITAILGIIGFIIVLALHLLHIAF